MGVSFWPTRWPTLIFLLNHLFLQQNMKKSYMPKRSSSQPVRLHERWVFLVKMSTGAKGGGSVWCATCDAPLYKDHEVVVVGGGNSAITESYELSKHAKKVTLIQIGPELTATDPLTDKVLATDNIKVIYSQKVVEVKGNGEKVTGVVLENQKRQNGF